MIRVLEGANLIRNAKERPPLEPAVSHRACNPPTSLTSLLVALLKIARTGRKIWRGVESNSLFRPATMDPYQKRRKLDRATDFDTPYVAAPSTSRTAAKAAAVAASARAAAAEALRLAGPTAGNGGRDVHVPLVSRVPEFLRPALTSAAVAGDAPPRLDTEVPLAVRAARAAGIVIIPSCRLPRPAPTSPLDAPPRAS